MDILSQIALLNSKPNYAVDEANERLKRGGKSPKYGFGELRDKILNTLNYEDFFSTVEISDECDCNSQVACSILKRLRKKGFVENGPIVRSGVNKQIIHTWRRIKNDVVKEEQS